MPWVILMLNFDTINVVGIAIGHIYYYFEDIFPRLKAGIGFRLFKAPVFLEYIIRKLEG